MIVTDNGVILNYTMPWISEHTPIDNEEVLPVAHYGGRYCTIGGTFELSFNLTWLYIGSSFFSTTDLI